MAIRDLLPDTWTKRHVPVRQESDALSPFNALQREMNHLFDHFFENSGMPSIWNKGIGDLFPKVDVKETEKEILVEAELPGMDEKDIEISVSDNALMLHGEKQIESEEKKEGYYHCERSYGKFHRDIPLPTEVETGNVEAVFEKGVLTVRLPKKPEAQRKSKRIEIKAG